MPKQEVTKRLPGNNFQSDYKIAHCAVIAGLKIFATKWKPCIICFLSSAPVRYNELFRIIPNISRKVLSEHLDELEADGIIDRLVFDEKLQRVEYALNEKGRSLLPLISQIQDWGLSNLSDVLSINQMIEQANFFRKNATGRPN